MAGGRPPQRRNASKRGLRGRGRSAEARAQPGESGRDGGPPPPPARRRRLRTLANVRAALADVVRGVEGGTLDLGHGRVLVYGLSVLGGIVEKAREQGELLRRIEALEAVATARNNNGAAGSWRPPPPRSSPTA